ncbi:MAG: SH3 domain-containing protein [Anaerolineales bacterium]
MEVRRIAFIGRLLGIFLLFILSACNLPSRNTGTPTPSSEQVLATAQAIVQATLDAITPTATRLPPSDTPGPPTETFTPEPTGTPSIPTAVADYNANIRSGPGEEYEVIDFILAGEAGEIVGRWDDTPIGPWFFIRRFGETGRDGWVWGGAVTLTGNEAGIPFMTPAPTPTSTAEPTAPPTETPAAATP